MSSPFFYLFFCFCYSSTQLLVCDIFVKIDDAFSGLSSSDLTVPQLMIISLQLRGLLSAEVFPITNSINISKGSLAFLGL